MDPDRRTARIVGALFLTSNVTFVVGAIVLVESILGAPDYLTLVSANRARLVLGVLLAQINGVAFVSLAVLMFPILRRRHESLALGYVGFRIIEYLMQIAADVGALSLLTISEEFVRAGAAASSSLPASGALLLAERYWAFQMLSLIFGISALMFYYMLYQSRLIPRFISAWGFIGAALVLANVLTDMFGLSFSPLMVGGLAMLLNELFLGVWLIVKGFQPSAVASEAA